MTAEEEIELLDLEEEELLLKRKKASLSVSGPSHTKAESAAMGVLQSGSLGYADEIQAGIQSGSFSGPEYEGLRDKLRAEYKQGEEAHPGFYNLGDYGTSAATAIATGPAKLVGQAGKAGYKELAKRLGRESVEGAVVSGVESVGRSEKEGSELIGEGLTGAAIGGLAPSAIGIGKKAIKTALPLPMKGKGVLNKLAGKIADVRGAGKGVAKKYKEILDDPARHTTAIRAGDNFDKDFQKTYLPTVEKFKDDIEGSIEKQYQRDTKKAFKDMAKTAEDIRVAAIRTVDDAIDKVRQFPKNYSPKALNALEVSRGRLNYQSPEAYDLRKAWDSMDKQDKLNSIEQFAGGLVTEAKRDIYKAMKFAGREGGRDADEKVLGQVSKALNKITHDPNTAGGRLMKKADKMWEDFENKGRHMLDNFTGNDPGSHSTYNVHSWAKDSGGATKAKRELYRTSMDDFLKKYDGEIEGLSPKTLENFENTFKGLRDYQDMNRLQKDIGSSTGASAGFSGMLGGAAAGLATLTGAENPYQIASVVTALTLPLAQPAMYNKAIGIVREFIDREGEAKAKSFFGRRWQDVKKALVDSPRAAGRAATRGVAHEDPFGAQNLYQDINAQGN